MSFTISPKGAAHLNQIPGAKAADTMSAKEKAIARLMSNSPHSEPLTSMTMATKEVTPESGAAPVSEAPQAVDTTSSLDSEPRLNNISVAPTETAASAPSNEPASASEATDKVLSSEYATLARKEKALRAREASIRAKEVAHKAAEDARLAPAKPAFDESRFISREKLESDLFGTLSELGLLDQASNPANAPSPEQLAFKNEMKALKDEIKALRGETESTKKSFETQQQESYKQTVNQIKIETQSLVNHNPEFETIKETGSINDVVELIERTFKEDGILLTVEEAAQQVEDHLVEEALKIARIGKIRQKLMPVAAPAAPAIAPKSTEPKQQQIKTLTNQLSSSRQLSARERAIMAATGKLK